MKSVWLILAGLFWLGMNFLLWRSEYGGGSQGNPLPVKTVISKILETPDPSELEIYYQNESIGGCRWVVTQVGEGDVPDEITAEDDVDIEAAEMAGLIRNIEHFAIQIDGHLQWKDESRRIRFMLHLDLSPSREWIAFDAKVGFPGAWFQIESRRINRLIRVQFDQGDTTLDMELSFDQLENPEALIAHWTAGNPMIAGLIAPLVSQIATLRSSLVSGDAGASSLGSDWKAFSDWISVAHSRMRIYRLESQGTGRQSITLTTNKAGEILTVTLPHRVALKNEDMLGF